MLFKALKEIINVSFGGRAIAFICHGARQVWQAARACFSDGWDDDKGWFDDEGWGD